MADFSRFHSSKIIGILCSLLVMGGVVAGYFYLRGRHVRQVETLQKSLAAPQPTPLPPQITVYENEPTLRGSQAVLSGTIRNISPVDFEDLSVELELIPRQGEATESKQLAVRPAKLAPDDEGKYQLLVSSANYRGARVAKVIAKNKEKSPTLSEVPFSVEDGARRAKESPPGANRPLKRSSREEFLNSPDNPIGLP